MALLNHRTSAIVIALVIIFLSFASPSFAEKVTFVKEYTYQASELDSKASCRTISLEMVKRLLLEELGTYLISETEVKDFKLTKEQVKTYSAGIVGAEIIEDKWDGKTYWLKARVSADPKEVAKSLKKIMDDQFKARELEETRKKAEELVKEVERLKLEVAKLGSQKKQPSKKVQQEYKAAIQGLTAIEWYQKGLSLSTTYPKDLDASINAFTKAIELNPEDARFYISRGSDFALLGTMQKYYGDNNYEAALEFYRKAISDFDKAIEINPKLVEAYTSRGQSYQEIKNYQRAISDFNESIKLNQKDASVYYQLGDVYREIGMYEEAIHNFNISIKLPRNKWTSMTSMYKFAYFGRGAAYLQLGKYKQAEKDFAEFIEIFPSKASAYIMCGDAYFSIHKYQRAIDYYTAAIKVEPGATVASYNRGVAYDRLGKHEQAIKDFQVAARLGYEPAQEFLREKGISW